MAVDEKWRHRCAVLGHPIAHSLSPLLHEAAYSALGLEDWHYGRHDVDEDQLPDFLNGLDPTWAGLSLTMPLKRSIMPLGTPSDRWSRELGVANTAVFDWGSAPGPHIALYNTDVRGMVLAFQHHSGFGVPTSSPGVGTTLQAVILGNGNTAMSALAACTDMAGRVRVTVAARHPDANPAFARFAASHRHHIELSVIPLDDVMRHWGQADVVISTLPAHAADALARRCEAECVQPRGTLLDVVYDPRPSALMRAWRGGGGAVIGGETMLLYQAIAQVCLMTALPSAWIQGGDLTEADRALEQAMGNRLKEAL